MTISLFQEIVKALPRRQIKRIVATHESDKWTKKLGTFEHLLVMVYAQLSGHTSLRDLEASFNASPQRHYHLGAQSVRRSTLSDANATRPAAVFEDILALLLKGLSRQAAQNAKAAHDLVRILDSTTIGLFAKTHRALRYRSNNSAIKLHLMLDPASEAPVWFALTPARFHDSKVCGDLPLHAGETYVFDRAYNNADFWNTIDRAGAVFVTRPKTTLAFDVIAGRLHPDSLIVADETIRLARNPGEKYQKPLRRVEVMDDENGRTIAFITNDFQRSPEDVASLYRRRWQIETFFKWLKQNLKIRRFLAKNPKAIRLQIITALIAYVLLKLLHKAQRIAIPLKRVAALARTYLFNQNGIRALLKPPNDLPPFSNQNQLALNFPGQ